jgi:uncharacterized integral membrane protein (TIGR00698 family)
MARNLRADVLQMPFARRAYEAVRERLPGALLAALISLAAAFIVTRYGGPMLLLALLLGMAFNFLSEDPKVALGLDFCTRTVLRVGVALLGARITFEQIATLGWRAVLIVVLAIFATMLFSRFAARRLGLSGTFAALSGTAVSICGVSAALAAASVLPERPELQRQTVIVCIAVTALSTIAMLLYPLLASFAGFTQVEGGVFLGATIHDVAQVIGAGYTMSATHGDVATVTKLLRVLMLAPLVLVLAALIRRTPSPAGASRRWHMLLPPWFLLAFIVVVSLNSAHLLSVRVVGSAVVGSQACLILAIAALGLRTSLAGLREVGWRPLLLMVGQTVFLAAAVAALLIVTA